MPAAQVRHDAATRDVMGAMTTRPHVVRRHLLAVGSGVIETR